MAGTFDVLRANDLIFNYVVSNWLMGQDPPAFDILAWNADSTRMPAAMHAFYLRNFYVENKLAAGTLEIAGKAIDLGAIKAPTYVVSAINDHIVPWESSYKTTGLVSGPVRFVLSSGGHIAGIVNPPGPEGLVPGRADRRRAAADGRGVARAAPSGAAAPGGRTGRAGRTSTPARCRTRRRMGSERHPVLGDGPGYLRPDLTSAALAGATAAGRLGRRHVDQPATRSTAATGAYAAAVAAPGRLACARRRVRGTGCGRRWTARPSRAAARGRGRARSVRWRPRPRRPGRRPASRRRSAPASSSQRVTATRVSRATASARRNRSGEVTVCGVYGAQPAHDRHLDDAGGGEGQQGPAQRGGVRGQRGRGHEAVTGSRARAASRCRRPRAPAGRRAGRGSGWRRARSSRTHGCALGELGRAGVAGAHHAQRQPGPVAAVVGAFQQPPGGELGGQPVCGGDGQARPAGRSR